MHAGSAGRWPNVLVRTGIPARQIVDTIKQVRADILAVGPPRRRALRETLEGTIAAKALREPKCPLLIVRQEPRAAYRNVLLALDLSAISGGALRAAESLVLAADTQARIVHAYEPPYQGMLHYADVGMASAAAYGRGGKREAMTAVRDLIKYQSADFTRYEIVIAEAQPAEAILRAVEHCEPDLLVMGTRGRGRIRRALLGHRLVPTGSRVEYSYGSVALRDIHDVLGCGQRGLPGWRASGYQSRRTTPSSAAAL